MKKLFIIGNGFDCYGHGMKIKYSDFKDYLMTRFTEYNENFDGLLLTTMMPDGEKTYNMDDVVGSMIRVLNYCVGEEWGTLEACLGCLYVKAIIEDNEWALNEIDWQNDNDIEWRDIYNNENIATNITGAYARVRELFDEWVVDELGKIIRT